MGKLSQENIDKLCMTGLYSHKPEVRLRGTLYAANLYHCCNWTFKVRKWDDGRYFMRDTYWGDNQSLRIELTDDNIDEFTLIFDFNNVKKHSGNNIYDYDENDRFHVAVDSGGMYCGGKYFIKKGAKKNKDKVLARLQEEIDSLERSVKSKQRDYQRVVNDEIDMELI